MPLASNPPEPSVFLFGVFRFDADTLELRRSGRPVRLAPLPARVLARLLVCPGVLVRRQDLADAIWGPGAYVDAVAGLNTAVRQIRRALGDAAERPLYVETLPRRGYRFIAPVTVGIGEVASPGPETKLAVTTVGAAAPGRSSRRASGWSIGVAVLALSVVFFWRLGAGEGIREREKAVARVDPPIAIEVTPSSEAALDRLSHGLAEELRARLEGEIVDRYSQHTSGGAHHRLELRAARGPWPGHARLEASFRGGARGEGSAEGLPGVALPLLATTVEVDTFPSVRDDIALLLARRLAVTRETFAANREAASRNPQAWLYFLDALAAMEEKIACDGDGPANLLERALELDCDFASAWYLLAVARGLHANLCSGGQESYERATAAARRAAALAPTWIEPIQLEAGILVQQGRLEDAMARISAAEPIFPDSPFLIGRRAEILRYAGFLDASRRDFDRVLELKPSLILQSDTVAYPYLYLERWDRFLELLPARTGPFFRYYRGWAESQRGQIQAARFALSPAFEEHPGDAFARLSQALLAILDERPEEARVTLTQLARQRKARQAIDGEMSFKIGQLMILAGAPEVGLEQLELAVEQGFLCAACLGGHTIADRLRGSPRYRALLEASRRRQSAFAARFDLAI